MTTLRRSTLRVTLLAMLLAGTVQAGTRDAPMQLAQAGHAGHGSHAGHGASAGETASTTLYREANERMHAGMAIDFTGDADIDFAAGMIPHHQGAIDMARVILVHGRDPDLRRLAEEIIAAQEKEIAFLRSWLKARGR